MFRKINKLLRSQSNHKTSTNITHYSDFLAKLEKNKKPDSDTVNLGYQYIQELSEVLGSIKDKESESYFVAMTIQAELKILLGKYAGLDLDSIEYRNDAYYHFIGLKKNGNRIKK